MNLVSVENVVGAIFFLTQLRAKHKYEIFIISEDNNKKNNYQRIEKIIMKYLENKGLFFSSNTLTSKLIAICFKFFWTLKY
jgi:hypothetical protein